MASEKSGEFRGRTIEAAISTGLAALGLARDQVEIEVVRQGSRGLLGIGAEDAVVRLTAISGQRAEPVVKAEPRTETTPAGRAEPVARAEPKPPATEGKAAPKPEAKAPSRPPRPKTSRGEGSATDMPQVATGEPAAAQEGDIVERGRDVLEHMLALMNLRAHVEVIPQSEAESEPGENATVLNIVGEDLGMLIGRQSEVLNALQFLTRLMVNQESHGRTNLVIDVNGYKSKRAESLRKLAVRTADQVTQTGRTMALEPMPPAERRIIHLTLRDHPTVITQSVGEGSRRKVTVVPKKD